MTKAAHDKHLEEVNKNFLAFRKKQEEQIRVIADEQIAKYDTGQVEPRLVQLDERLKKLEPPNP